jgi:hypothetical protein
MSSDRTVRSGKRLPSSSWGLGTGSPESRLRPETNVSVGSGFWGRSGTPGKRVIDEISLLQPEAVQGHGALNSGLSHNGALQSKLEAQYSEKSPAEFLDHAAGGS